MSFNNHRDKKLRFPDRRTSISYLIITEIYTFSLRSLTLIMFIDQYCTPLENNRFSFTRQQASDFAKHVANDYNPLHDVDNTRFCVPGDLLFAKILMSEGLSADMKLVFDGMVSEGTELEIRCNEHEHESIYDIGGKRYLDIETHGVQSHDKTMLEHLIRSYVAFSGANFPDVFIPLMKEKGVMVNTVRPLVIYESMTLHLDRVDLVNPKLEAAEAEMIVNGRRGKVILNFIYKDANIEVGRGQKVMVLSGLRPYDQAAIDTMIDTYHERRARFTV